MLFDDICMAGHDDVDCLCIGVRHICKKRGIALKFLLKEIELRFRFNKLYRIAYSIDIINDRLEVNISKHSYR